MEPFPSNICIVDDDADFVGFLAEYLRLKGCRCTIFVSAEEMMRSGGFENYDFFIIDLGLPGIDGTDLTALIRGRSAAGILVVSGRLGPDAFNSALAAGADMFVNKPVRFDQVSHAIASIWRRFAEPRARVSAWSIAPDLTKLISPLGREVPLSPLESRLINKLRQSGSETVSRSDLAEASGVAGSMDHRNLDAAFFRLRRKIERDSGGPSPFRTVHGVGYRLTEDIEDGQPGSI